MGSPAAQLQPPRQLADVVGTIEIVGQLSPSELMIGGWSQMPGRAGAPILALTADGAVEGRWWTAWSDRPDVGAGTGFVGVAEFREPIAAGRLLGLRLGGGRALRLYEQRSLLQPQEAIARLREGGAAKADPVLARVAARFDGTDTVATSSLPVRAGIDDCVALPGAMLVHGWIFDPERLAEAVLIAGSAGEARLDQSWVTRRRPDVVAAMANEPRFAPYADPNPWCGLSAIVQTEVLGCDLHLTIRAGDTDLHMPLVPRQGNALPLLRSFLLGLDPGLSSSIDVAERQVAPVLARVQPQAPRLQWLSREGADGTSAVALVIATVGVAEDLAGLLAMLAIDPKARKLPIIVAGAALELAAHQGEIERAAEAFGLTLALALGEGIEDAVDAFLLGATVTEAETLVLFSADHVPGAPGALSQMLTAARPGTVVVPTVFDAAMTGPETLQRDRARRLADASVAVVPRQAVLAARPAPMLDAAGRAAALLETFIAGGLDLVAVEGADVLSPLADPARDLLRRADRRAQVLRQAELG